MLIILGSGRSGTTWLAKMFDSHPDVAYLHEPDSVLRNHDLPFLPDRGALDNHTKNAAAYLTALQEVRSPKAVAHLPQFPKSYRTGGRACLRRLAANVSKAVAKLPLGAEQRISLPDLFDDNKAPSALVMKSVNSLCRMALFERANPTARFIHIIRHPAGVVSSLLRSRAAGADMANAYLPSIFQLPEASHYRFTYNEMVSRPLCDQLAFSWMVHNDKASLDMEQSSRYRTIVYEDLCTDVASRLKPLFSFAGLDWQSNVEEFIRSLKRNKNYQPSYFDILRPPTVSMNQWRQKLTADQIAAIQEITAEARSAPVRAAAQF